MILSAKLLFYQIQTDADILKQRYTVIIPNGKYNDAIALMDAGNIVEAYEALVALDGYKDSADKANSIYDKYTSKEIKDIYFHRIILFIMFFAVLAISAMRPIIEIYSVIGYMICLFLSAITSYFMSFTVFEWCKKKGYWVYILIIGVLVLMFFRNN